MDVNDVLGLQDHIKGDKMTDLGQGEATDGNR